MEDTRREEDTIELQAKARKLVAAVYADIHPTWPALTDKWLMQEAEHLIAGGECHGSPGMMLEAAFKRAGII